MKTQYSLNFNLPRPNYSDPYWNTERTVWGVNEEGLSYVYSDRLYEFDFDKEEKSREEANKQLGRFNFTPEWVQLYLSLYYDKPVEIKHILAGVKPDGYAYYCYGFNEVKNTYPKFKGVGTTNEPRCPKCLNSFQNGVPAGSINLRRCATCKTVFSAPADEVEAAIKAIAYKGVENATSE